jgi:hypothetical protein
MPMIVDRRIPRTQCRGESRRSPATGRPQSPPRYGAWVGPHRGLRAGQVSRGGTRELRRAQASPWVTAGAGVPSVEGKTPGAGRPLAPLQRALWRQKAPKARRATQGIGDGQGTPNAPETGHWPSERLRVPRGGSHGLRSGKVGNQRPRAPREGRRRRASRVAGGT